MSFLAVEKQGESVRYSAFVEKFYFVNKIEFFLETSNYFFKSFRPLHGTNLKTVLLILGLY